MDKYKLSLRKGENMNNKKLFEKENVAKATEIKKEGELKMKEFSVLGGLKNVWANHKDLFKNVAIMGLAAGCLYLGLRGPKVEVRYEQLPPIVVTETVEVPVEVPQAVEEDNNVRN